MLSEPNFIVGAKGMARLAVLVVVLLADGISNASEPVLEPLWQAQLALHSPVNVVVGRIAGRAQLCVQGALLEGDRSRAAIQMLDAHGNLLWTNQHSDEHLNFLAGAYVQWISGPGIERPYVLYSYTPRSSEKTGGALLVDAAEGQLVSKLKNTTQFGNNNAIVADLDHDGQTDLLYPDLQTLTRYELPSLKQVWRWDRGIRFCWSLPGLFDLDRDGQSEIVFGSEYNNRDGSSSVVALSSAGKQIWRSDGHVEDLGSTPIFFADVDQDGSPELLKVGLDLEHRHQQQWNHLYVFDAEGKLKSKIELGFTGIAIGDLDRDGHLEGVGLSNTRDGGNNGRREIRCLDLATGELEWTTPVERAYLDTNSPLMADVNGDGHLEVIVGTGNPAGYARLPNSEPWGDLYVVDSAGKILQHESLPGWPTNLAYCDLETDGRAELVVVIDGKPGSLAVYRTHGSTDRRDWPTPFGDAQRTGTMAVRE